MDHLLLTDSTGRIVVSRMPEECKAVCLEQAPNTLDKFIGLACHGTRRRSKQTGPTGTVFLCTDNPDLVSSKRVFQKQIQFYGEMIGTFQEVRDETVKRLNIENRRLVHNLTTLNSHILQEIYDITPQEQLTGSPNNQVQIIRDAILRNPDRTAAGALRILKNAVAARTEMQIVRRLQPSEAQAPLNPKSHSLHKVVTNSLITFFQDSIENGLEWQLGQFSKKVTFDYETVSVALYRLFENAVKYCMPNSEIRISFGTAFQGVKMVMEMTSLWINYTEREEIFREGKSGAMAIQAGLNGDGLGLYFVREMLLLNRAEIRWEPIVNGNPMMEGRYGRNRFVVTLLQ